MSLKEEEEGEGEGEEEEVIVESDFQFDVAPVVI